MKKNAIIGILGTRLDSAKQKSRWKKWRPSVAVCQHIDFDVHQYDLLYPASHSNVAAMVQSDAVEESPGTQMNLHEINFEDPWDFEEVFATLHDFARGYEFRTDKYDYFIHITTGSHVQQICLFLLTESRHLPGVLLQTGPPKNRVSGVAGTRTVIDLNLSRYDALAARFAKEQLEGQEYLKAGIATRNHDFNRLIERMERVAISSKAPLLLTGPTGAGKTNLARRIYELKRRREQLDGAFVEVNCATLRGDHAMSTLFGHTKGAFTGAASARQGLLKSADQGLLFLDEIGELGLDEQAMLLGAIELKRFLPVGSDKEVSANFQIIAGTNRDLQQAIAKGRFRDDLLARINLWSFNLPGLADRREDIEPNLDFELERITNEFGHRIRMTHEARNQFLEWAQTVEATWKSNFRDLSAAVTRMATLATNGRIETHNVIEEISRLKCLWVSHNGVDAASQLIQLPASLREKVDLFEEAQLATVLQVCREEPTMAAAGRRLFNVSRRKRSSTNDSDRLRKYLQRFEIDWKELKTTSSLSNPDS